MNSQQAQLTLASPLRDFVLGISDAVWVLDAQGQVVLANTAGRRMMGGASALALPGRLADALGASAASRVHERLELTRADAGVTHAGAAAPGGDPFAVTLREGHGVRMSLHRLDTTHWALHARPASHAGHSAIGEGDASRELIGMFWDSPFPVTVQDQSFRLVAVNDAYVQFCGHPRERLMGLDPLLLQPEEDRASSLAVREQLARDFARRDIAPLQERRIIAADGHERWFRAARRAIVDARGGLLYLAVLQDCSDEHAARQRALQSANELEVARLEIGAMTNGAGVGVASFQESAWMDSGSLPPSAANNGSGAGALPSIARELVRPASLCEYDRVQQALRLGHSGQACYAIDHPELGLRWLLTRVEPARLLASGKRTSSAVTIDVTEREEARTHNERLLRELETIVESTPAGIFYLRAEVLVRCNRRFERLIGVAPGGASGKSLRTLFEGATPAGRLIDELLQALAEERLYETEFELQRQDGGAQWCSLHVRNAVAPGTAGGAGEAIGVLADITRLKLQQREMQALARDRELMFNLSEIGIAYVRDGRVQRANEAMQRLAGYEADALSGLPVERLFIDPAHYQRTLHAQETELRTRGRASVERRLLRRDGSLVWVQVNTRLVIEGDLAGGVIASYVDVEERREAQRLLALQAERTRAVLDSVLVGIVTVDARGIEWMNRSARRMFGGQLADFIGLPIATVATDDDAHPLRQAEWLSGLPEGQAATFECRIAARDGRCFWVAGNAVATSTQQGGRQLTYALLDIEQRHEAEASIARAQASLQRIIEMAPLAIMLYDARSLAVLQTNQSALALTGKSIDEVIGRTPQDIYPAEFAHQLRTDLQAALDSAEVTRREYVSGAAGEQRVWDARFMPLAAAGQAPDQLLVVATDVTDQRAAEQARLDAAIAQREMLIKELHHRIKNNLQGVAGLLQQAAARHPETAAILGDAAGQVQALAQVYGLQVGASGPLRVKSVAEAIVRSVGRSYERDIALSSLGPALHRWALPEAEAIPIALTLNELLVNAIKHCTPGALECVLHFDASCLRITVSNPGRLPAGFDLGKVRGGVSGLGLVRALLPRRGAALTLAQAGERVVAQIELEPPGVTFVAPL